MTTAVATRWVDVFAHPRAEGGMRALAPHLPDAWRERFAGLRALDNPYFNGATPDELAAGPLAGGDQAVLVPFESVNTWPDPELTTTILRAANDHFTQALDAPVAALVCAQDPLWSAAELGRLDGRVVAAALAPMQSLLGDPVYRPLLAACADAGLPLIVYPTGAEGVYLGAPEPAGGAQLGEVERRCVRSQIAQAQIASLVFSGALTRTPELRVVFAGFGFSWLVPLLWRMDMDWRRTRIETPWVKHEPSEYVRAQVRFTAGPDDAPRDATELEELLVMAMAEDVLLYGSGFPDDTGARAWVDGLAEPLRSRVAHANALAAFPRLAR
jgi:predicted TIM-barrel fold metal-dependent hydrolase